MTILPAKYRKNLLPVTKKALFLSQAIKKDMSDFSNYVLSRHAMIDARGRRHEIHSCDQLMELIQHMGFLPLLEGGIPGYCAEGVLDDDCRFTRFDDGSWVWPLWQWKSVIVTEGNCVYGKFFAGKAGFISQEWWPHFYNWRRSVHRQPEPGTIEDTILTILRSNGSMIARQLRAACGFTGSKMRSRFDSYIGRLQMECRIVTEDFVYPRDKHGREYGFGWSLLTTPELLLGTDACHCDLTPEQSYSKMLNHLAALLPDATETQIAKLLK